MSAEKRRMPEYELIRSGRRTVSLEVDEQGRVRVRAPMRLPKAQIEAFVLKNLDWIEKKRAETAERRKQQEAHEPLSAEPGSKIYLLGYKLTVCRGSVSEPMTEGGMLILPPGTSLRQLRGWLVHVSAVMFRIRIDLYAKAMGVTYGTLRVSDAKSRWGSCGRENSINLTWRLIMCPMELIDYVVVHELCHTVHKNHGHGFWAMVESVFPDAKARRRRLRDEYGWVMLV